MRRHQAAALAPVTSVGVQTVSASSECCRVVGLIVNGWSASLRSGELRDAEADPRAKALRPIYSCWDVCYFIALRQGR